jgi:FAD/FMN-containing dehydrogenase
MLPDGKAWLVVEMGGGNAAEAEAEARGLMAQVTDWTAAPHARVIGDPAQQSEVWELRESALGATARLPDGQLAWTGWDDSAVAPENLGRYLRALLKLYEHYGYQASIYGHFGEGCIHHRLNLDLTSAPGIATYRSFAYQAAELVVAMGGSISGEHGDGQSRAELLPIMFGPEMMDAFGRFKDLWDPEGGMNPGMVVRAGRIDDHRRLAPVTNQP